MKCNIQQAKAIKQIDTIDYVKEENTMRKTKIKMQVNNKIAGKTL